MRPIVHPVGPVLKADLAGVSAPLESCAACGYLGAWAPSISGGLGLGSLRSERLCTRCGHAGPPAVFATQQAYLDFVHSLHAAR